MGYDENHDPDWPCDVPGVPTKEVADFYNVLETSVREGLCRKGSYFGLRPRRQANGRLAWPPDYRERLLKFQQTDQPHSRFGPKQRLSPLPDGRADQ